MRSTVLVDEGYVERRAGKNNAKLHTSLKPYVEALDFGDTPNA